MFYVYQIIFLSISFLILDAIWFRLFMNAFAKSELGSILRLSEGEIQVKKPMAGLAYLTMVLLAVIFLFPRFSVDSGIVYVATLSFCFGFLVFGLFDFTSGALFKGYSTKFAIIDSLWGGTVYCLSSVLGFYLGLFV